MKRIFPILLSLSLLLAACGSAPAISTEPTETSPTTQPSESQVQTQQMDMTAVALPATVETLSDTNGNEIFSYTYQSMSLVVADPDVADKIILDFFSRQDQHRTSAEAIHTLATENYTEGDWVPYLFSALYNPMRVDENVLSLAGTTVSWSGGNHPNYNCVYANYDMVTGDVMTLGSILTHKDKAAELCDLVIDAIAEVQEQYSIWSDYDKIIRNRFASDISYDSAWFFDTNGLCFRFTPYEIAPYSSGIITVTIPYSKLTGIIEDAYFPVEQQVVQAEPKASLMSQTNAEDFSQIAELVLDENGTMVLLYTDTLLYNVRIKVTGSPDYTAFSAAALTPGDAIMVQGDFDSNTLILEYRVDNQTYERYICVTADTVELSKQIPE